MGSLFLVRHATTAASAAGRNLGGASDPALLLKGEALAAQTGKAIAVELAALSHDQLRLVTSPALRCRQTGAAIAAELRRGVAAEVEPALREIDYGQWEGLTAAESVARDAARHATWEADPYETATPGGESGREVATRSFPIFDTLEAWLSADRARAAVVVSHNHVLRLRLSALLGLPLADYRRRVRTDPGGYSLVTFGAECPAVRRINARPR